MSEGGRRKAHPSLGRERGWITRSPHLFSAAPARRSLPKYTGGWGCTLPLHSPRKNSTSNFLFIERLQLSFADPGLLGMFATLLCAGLLNPCQRERCVSEEVTTTLRAISQQRHVGGRAGICFPGIFKNFSKLASF